jgi:hypothetical protein
MAPVPDDDPLMIAWKRYETSADYTNSFLWAAHEEHRNGSMWGAFSAGFMAAGKLREDLEQRLAFYVRDEDKEELADNVKVLSAENRDLRAALQFYAQHLHWMGVTSDPDCPSRVLIAHKGQIKGEDGWAVAEAALQQEAV